MTGGIEIKNQKQIDKAAKMLLSLGSCDQVRPSKPNKKDANRKFRAVKKADKYRIEEVE